MRSARFILIFISNHAQASNNLVDSQLRPNFQPIKVINKLYPCIPRMYHTDLKLLKYFLDEWSGEKCLITDEKRRLEPSWDPGLCSWLFSVSKHPALAGKNLWRNSSDATQSNVNQRSNLDLFINALFHLNWSRSQLVPQQFSQVDSTDRPLAVYTIGLKKEYSREVSATPWRTVQSEPIVPSNWALL